jgi:2-C-methyl-D-erythritol 4-phosphate cytidylyltransferase/2-C-methyl-D-erythritol 2,4-cyclodiphosphate synthase
MGGTYALIVAAGRGQRAGGGVPKQYRPVGGVPVLRRTVEAFCRHAAVDGICVAIHPDDRPLYDEAVADLPLLGPVFGGATRQASVCAGLERLASEKPDIVLVHDAARPFVPPAAIDRVAAAARDHGAAIAALPVVDTLKRATDGAIVETVDRTGLWRAQTPQGFAFPAILEAHRQVAGGDYSDDAAVAEAVGMTVQVVHGGEDNFKITTEDDLARAEALVTGRMLLPRTGYGFDVHAFAPGDHVWLCGVKVPHDRALRGHSDADVGLHALTDAILGAAADGDIGMHFSDKDPRWKGASSDRFLADALRRLAGRGGRLVHADVTVICEAPRVGPHREAMLASLARLTGLPAERIGLKATTTEKLGFLGRGEGIAAQAVATAVFAEAP